jgi:hypothetical protein
LETVTPATGAFGRVIGITAGSGRLPRFCVEAAELEKGLTVVTDVIVVAERLGHHGDCVDDETQPFEPGPLCPLFDLVAVRHDCSGVVAGENPNDRTRFRVVARRARVAEGGANDTPPRLRSKRVLARVG